MQQDLKHILQALKFVWASSKRLTVVQLFLLIFQSFLPLINIYLLKLLIDEIEVQAKNQGENYQSIIYYLAFIGGILLFTNIVNIVSQYVTTAQSQRVTDYMSSLLQAKSIEIDLHYYEDPKYHDTLHRAQTQGLFRPVRVLQSLTSTLQSGFSLTAIAALFLLLHWGIAVVFILTALPAFFIKIYFSRVLYDWQRKTTQMERESYYLNTLVTSEEYVKEIRIFDVAHIFMNKFKALRARLYTQKMGIEGKRARAEIFSKAVEIAATIGIYGFVAYRAAQGSITVGDFVMYFQAFQKGQSTMKTMLTSLATVYENRLFLKYIFEFLQIEPQVQNSKEPISIPQLNEKITFKNVSFSYPSTRNGQKALQNINLEFKKGEVIALVGENGSGKTTLIKLLSRLYDVDDGSIEFDNEDIKNLNLSELRQKISVIFQDYSKYHLSVRDNIQIGNMHFPLDEDKIKDAANNTGAAQFIENLPDAYDNMLGLRFKKGTELSGGQWQKIALARAFYKNADIIILDEPTSAIDPLAEHEIFEKFRSIAQGKILILITHRLYNLKMANKIVVMDKGEIIETGNHKTLVEQKGKYFQMFEKQMQ